MKTLWSSTFWGVRTAWCFGMFGLFFSLNKLSKCLSRDSGMLKHVSGLGVL